MPPKVYIDSERRFLEAVSPVPLAPGDDDRRESYPYPYLRISGPKQETHSRIAVLENDFVRAKFDLDLGGRLISLVDLPSGDECLPAAADALERSGIRGVCWQAGVCWNVGGLLREDLAPIDFLLEEPEAEDDPAVLWLFAIVAGTGLSYHARFELLADSRAVKAEFRVVNRTFEGRSYDPAIEILVPHKVLNFRQGVSCGRCGIAWEPGVFSYRERSRIARFSSPEWLPPRQTDSFRFSFMPLPAWDETIGVAPEVAVGRRGDTLVVSPPGPHGTKTLYVDVDGQTLEAPLPVGTLNVLEFGGFRHKVFQLSDTEWFFHAPSQGAAQRTPEAPLEPGSRYWIYLEEVQAMRTRFGAATAWESAIFDPSLRPACHLLASFQRAQLEEYKAASASLENALGYNAEDPLTWISKAIIERLAGNEDQNAPELPNAHYLAPLEPLLRAAAFLSQEHHLKEPSQIIAPLADDPEAMIEVACFLIDLGVHGEALKWIDECWRHRQVPMLQYLAAYALWRWSTMDAEAAQRIAMVGRMPINPPYPWRESERAALSQMVADFSKDTRLAEMLRLIEWAQPTS